MYTLILNTAYNLEVTILKDESIVAEIKSQEKRADKYMQIIDEAFKKAKINISQINQIAVNIGPGSFTGLRIAVSVAKGLAYGKNIKLLSFTSFDQVRCDNLISGKNFAIVLPAFSEFVYVKYPDRTMDCVIPSQLKCDKFVTIADEIVDSFKSYGKDVQLAEFCDGEEIIKIAQKVKDMTGLRPLYLRKSQAEIQLEERKKN